MTDHLEPLRTALTGRYRPERVVGQGGMATVYVAHDIRHDRQVALKVLRPELAAAVGADRFLSEIKVTAHLQHPHILPLFDSGEANGFVYYVMPFVEGETLRARILRERQLPVADAVRVASEVSDALAHAHSRGIVHRDIKPENILLAGGHALVADFGIALAVQQAAGAATLTQTGFSIGTPQYMSPEQACGDRPLDARSDVFSLGCVVYEMLVGDPPLTGATPQALVAKLLHEVPTSVSQTRRFVPSNVDAAVDQALAKTPADRFQTVEEFAAALKDPDFRHATDARHGRRPARWSTATWAFAALAGVLAITTWWAWTRSAVESRGSVARFELTFPEGHALQMPGGVSVSISPDGTRIVYVGQGASGGRQLWLRPLNQLEAKPIPGTEGALNPVFSPDAESVAYLTLGPTSLKVVSLAGAPPLTLAADSISQFALDWGPDGRLYFNRPDGRLARIPAAGGKAEDVTTPAAAAGEVFHRWVDVLPDGRGALFTIWRGFAEYDIGVTSFETGESRVLFKGMMARYATSGHVLFVNADGALLAAPFNTQRLQVTGSSSPLIKGVALDGSLGAFQFAISESGTLLYVPGEGGDKFQPVWVRRDGQERPLDVAFRTLCRCLALSPDGKRIAVAHRGETASADDIWVYDLEQEAFSRLTVEDSSDYRPFWSPDGQQIGFVSNRGGPQSLYAVPHDGSGHATAIASSPQRIWEGEWSSDGTLIYRDGTFGKRDIWYRPVQERSSPERFIDSTFDELMPTFSPNGRWVAYVSNESGRDEVYVRRLRGAGGRWQMSTGGGVEPVWAHSGRELFYRRPTREIVAVRVRTDPAFEVGPQSILFSGRDFPLADSHQGYDVSTDDQQFLMLKGVQRAQSAPLIVLGWLEELRQKARQTPNSGS